MKNIDEVRDDSSSLSDRDAGVVETIGQAGLSAFTFDGLRRLAGMHPETLSRSLERLEEQGIIERSPEGYSTTEKAKGLLSAHYNPGDERRVPLLHTFLPIGVSVQEVVTALRGRWFDQMRWVGISESEDGIVLKWVTDDGSALVDAKLSMSQLDVEARVRKGTDFKVAVRAAHQLMTRITRFYQSRRPSRMMMMRLDVPFATAAM